MNQISLKSKTSSNTTLKAPNPIKGFLITILAILLLINTISVGYSETKRCRTILVEANYCPIKAAEGRAAHQKFLTETFPIYSHTISGGSYTPSASFAGQGYSNYSYVPQTPRITSVRVPVSRNKMRTFTNKEGGIFEGRLLSINTTNKTARIRDKKGSFYNVPISRFCSSDVSYLKSWWTSRNPPKKISGYKAFLARREHSPEPLRQLIKPLHHGLKRLNRYSTGLVPRSKRLPCLQSRLRQDAVKLFGWNLISSQ